MKKAARITGPFPSMDEVAKELGISPARRRQIEQLLDELVPSAGQRPATKLRRRAQRATGGRAS
ncbi:MAG TPA: hypothetical protein VNJ11_10045 [Bryobacteraceae bacterium]|nr:hypothetical protein [Bryobacteraceae bacterium]